MQPFINLIQHAAQQSNHMQYITCQARNGIGVCLYLLHILPILFLQIHSAKTEFYLPPSPISKKVVTPTSPTSPTSSPISNKVKVVKGMWESVEGAAPTPLKRGSSLAGLIEHQPLR